ncbi:Proteasome subunit alpha [Candidatus Lokiarchaeum ossiferum]|uniref:Proteasome subunit alpha n=1 Tax=Candidatus Lokiarchaeum ossiferum TaxID=2951803 RepID=A0ABY6HRY4_9ARCH|nr:Proteasome subunit alpha [Candidatus Lokiarchaeum sp. B-35]
MGYDRAITIFSPDGRLFQVEYAIEAVRQGTTAIGVKSKDGVIFAVEKRRLPLQEYIGSEKLFKIDDHVGVAIAGLTADARTLVDQARVHAQVNVLSYNEKVSILETTRDLCDQMQLYTQNAGVRPFGVSLLVGGVDPDNGTKLFLTDPSGAFWGYHACAIGNGSPAAREYLSKEYNPDMSLEELKKLTINTLKEVVEGDFETDRFEIAMISTEDKLWKLLSVEENQALLDSLEE